MVAELGEAGLEEVRLRTAHPLEDQEDTEGDGQSEGDADDARGHGIRPRS